MTRLVRALLLAAFVALGAPAQPRLHAADAAPAGDAEPMGTIPGTTIARAKGGFLGIEVKGNHFKLSFYNAKKHPADVDVSRAVLRWPVHYQPNDERTVLSPDSDGKSMSSEKTVRAPLSFKLYISLFVGESEDAAETYVVDFSG